MNQVLRVLFFGTLVLLTASQEQGTNYNAGDSTRQEVVDPDGTVRGQYQYQDPEGKLITVRYKAGKDGFQVEGDHLPKSPQPQGGPPQQQLNPQYNNQQPQFFQQPQNNNNGFYNPQQHQAPQNNGFFNQQPQNFFPQQAPQPQQGFFRSQPAAPQQQFPNFPPQQPQNQFQGQQSAFSQPNSIPALPQTYNFNPQQPQAFYNQNQGAGNQGGGRPSKVSVSNNGQGFTYNIES